MLFRRSTTASGASSSTEHLSRSAKRGGAQLEDFYSYDDEELATRHSARREGTRTDWLGTEGRMIEVDTDYVRSRHDNIFDPEKLGAIASAVRSGHRPSFLIGYGEVSLIDKRLVQEDQELFEEGAILVDEPLQMSDVGKLLYTIRDGNHRTFGALIGGEQRVWISLMKDQLADVMAYRAAKKGNRVKELEKSFSKGYVDLLRILDRKLRED